MGATTELPRASTLRRALIVNADDLGLSFGINRGIMEAAAAGAVTSVSLMVGMPASEDAIQSAMVIGDRLGVGLHFRLTVGRPLTRADSLVDRATGEFLPLPRLVRRALTGGIRSAEVVHECRAQIRLARGAGLILTHLDGHQHIHVLPGVVRAVRHTMVAEGIPAVRRPSEALFSGPRWTRRLPQRTLIKMFAARAQFRAWPVRTTDCFTGGALMGAPEFEAGLTELLDRLPLGTTELMVHPGYARPPLPGNDPYLTYRELELRALLSPEVLRRLHSGRIQLLHFGSLSTCSW